jgi:hypothetical protein
MKNTKKPRKTLHLALLSIGLCLSLSVSADIRLAGGDNWENALPCQGGPRNIQELAEIQRGLRPRAVCPKSEPEKLDDAARAEAQRLAATPANHELANIERALGFQLYFDDRKYYIQPMRFMARDKPGEVCTPADFKGAPTYLCEEGQTYKLSCHLMFFNGQFEPIGLHHIRTDEPFPVWCNAVPAMGVYDKKKNELLVTFQYFPTDRKAASKISEVGSGWIRMTSLFRLKDENGRILVEQDDRCLKNPNRIESIPDARKALKRCHQTP